jgi:hypothetical protein
MDFHLFCAVHLGEEETHPVGGDPMLYLGTKTPAVRKGYTRTSTAKGELAGPSNPLTLYDGSSNINYCTILRGEPRFSRDQSVHV